MYSMPLQKAEQHTESHTIARRNKKINPLKKAKPKPTKLQTDADSMF